MVLNPTNAMSLKGFAYLKRFKSYLQHDSSGAVQVRHGMYQLFVLTRIKCGWGFGGVGAFFPGKAPHAPPL